MSYSFFLSDSIFTGGAPPVKSVPKRRHIEFSHRGITQKKEYNLKFVDRIKPPPPLSLSLLFAAS